MWVLLILVFMSPEHSRSFVVPVETEKACLESVEKIKQDPTRLLPASVKCVEMPEPFMPKNGIPT